MEVLFLDVKQHLQYQLRSIHGNGDSMFPIVLKAFRKSSVLRGRGAAKHLLWRALTLAISDCGDRRLERSV